MEPPLREEPLLPPWSRADDVLLERDIANVSIRHRYFGVQLRSALKDAILRANAMRAMATPGPKKAVGLAGAMMAAARAQNQASEDDKSNKVRRRQGIIVVTCVIRPTCAPPPPSVSHVYTRSHNSR